MLSATVIDKYALRPLQVPDAMLLAPVVVGLQPWSELGYTAAGLQRYLCKHDPALERWVLFDNEDLVGVICLRHPWLRGPFLELLCVLPNYQGRGLGSSLLVEIKKCAGDEGCSNIWVSAAHNNEKALSFYRRRGFSVAGVLPDLIQPNVDEVLLRQRF